MIQIMGSLCTYSIISTFFLLPPLLLYLLINDLVLPVPPLNKMEPRSFIIIVILTAG